LMIRYAFVKVGVPETDQAVTLFMTTVKFQVAGNLYTFEDWVNGVLRCNQKVSKHSEVPKKQFGTKDPRAKLVMDKLDVRIHFALNSGTLLGGSVSLPFSMYTCAKVEKELRIATSIFCDDDQHVLIKRDGEVFLAPVFDRYRCDFPPTDKGLMRTLGELTSSHKKADLRNMAEKNSLKITYLPYSWATNACNYDSFNKKSVDADVTGFRAYLRKCKPPKYASNEAQRLEALHKLNILDTLPEERFDRITKMVQQEFDLPIVLVSLVDEDRQWFKSNQWSCELPKPGETGKICEAINVMNYNHPLNKISLS
jgi:hypothetical protein